MVLTLDPQTYVEVTGNPFWETAMQEDYKYLLKKQTWDMVLWPSEKRFVRFICVYMKNKETHK
jgi:hypothetical protein